MIDISTALTIYFSCSSPFAAELKTMLQLFFFLRSKSQICAVMTYLSPRNLANADVSSAVFM